MSINKILGETALLCSLALQLWWVTTHRCTKILTLNLKKTAHKQCATHSAFNKNNSDITHALCTVHNAAVLCL